VLDIGMLGSPIFAKVRQGPLLADYFYEYAAPDLIESHETWSCQYLKLRGKRMALTARWTSLASAVSVVISSSESGI
jgi:hypothetical protein